MRLHEEDYCAEKTIDIVDMSTIQLCLTNNCMITIPSVYRNNKLQYRTENIESGYRDARIVESTTKISQEMGIKYVYRRWSA